MRRVLLFAILGLLLSVSGYSQTKERTIKNKHYSLIGDKWYSVSTSDTFEVINDIITVRFKENEEKEEIYSFIEKTNCKIKRWNHRGWVARDEIPGFISLVSLPGLTGQSRNN